MSTQPARPSTPLGTARLAAKEAETQGRAATLVAVVSTQTDGALVAGQRQLVTGCSPLVAALHPACSHTAPSPVRLHYPASLPSSLRSKMAGTAGEEKNPVDAGKEYGREGGGQESGTGRRRFQRDRSLPLILLFAPIDAA